jgi:predicted nucleotidyltransferase component of viral defense system
MGLADNPILTEEQKRLLQHFSRSDRRQSFYLTGGTALSAFYLFHRVSEDLDFFSSEQAEVQEILTFLRTLPDIVDMEYERKFDRKIFLLRHANGRMVRVEFTYYPFPRSEEGLLIEGFRIDSFKDILVNKLMALTDRRDPKDYVDLYVALKPQARSGHCQAHPGYRGQVRGQRGEAHGPGSFPRAITPHGNTYDEAGT